MLFDIGCFFAIIFFCQSGLCDESCRVPLGIKTHALPPDDRYMIDIEPPLKDYVPNEKYTIVLKSKDDKTKFIGFSIWITGDTAENPENPRKPKIFQAGRINPFPDDQLTHFAEAECPNTVIQTNVVAKTLIKAQWIAPPKGQHCVTIHAMVAIRPDMYYSGLTRRVCEDTRNREDMPPPENPNCSVCEDARYKMIFEGLWSYNTHRPLYPTSNTSRPSFSDIVGASHDKNYNIFISDKEASEGVKTLAEQGNTTKLEMDMQEKIGSSVRTIIKATRPLSTNATATAMFRVSSKHHLVSIVTAILPSPDWFLGASSLELCDAHLQTWTPSITYNLIPMDAGTDKGTDFNSANDNLMPPQPIGPAKLLNAPKEIKPFAKIHFQLIRTFKVPSCSQIEPENRDGEGEDNDHTTEEQGGDGEQGGNEEPSERTTFSSTSEVTAATDPESSSECPMTTWGEWDECVGACEDGKRRGQHKRERYHLVDNHPVDYGDEEDREKIPEACQDLPEDDFELCEEDCEETTTAEPISQQRLAPGHSWRMWFH